MHIGNSRLIQSAGCQMRFCTLLIITFLLTSGIGFAQTLWVLDGNGDSQNWDFNSITLTAWQDVRLEVIDADGTVENTYNLQNSPITITELTVDSSNKLHATFQAPNVIWFRENDIFKADMDLADGTTFSKSSNLRLVGGGNGWVGFQVPSHQDLLALMNRPDIRIELSGDMLQIVDRETCEYPVFEISSVTNAHVSRANQDSFDKVVCYTPQGYAKFNPELTDGHLNECRVSEERYNAVLYRLSSDVDGHIREWANEATPPYQDLCFGNFEWCTVVDSTSVDLNNYDFVLGYMSDTTNAHYSALNFGDAYPHAVVCNEKSACNEQMAQDYLYIPNLFDFEDSGFTLDRVNAEYVDDALFGKQAMRFTQSFPGPDIEGQEGLGLGLYIPPEKQDWQSYEHFEFYVKPESIPYLDIVFHPVDDLENWDVFRAEDYTNGPMQVNEWNKVMIPVEKLESKNIAWVQFRTLNFEDYLQAKENVGYSYILDGISLYKPGEREYCIEQDGEYVFTTDSAAISCDEDYDLQNLGGQCCGLTTDSFAVGTHYCDAGEATRNLGVVNNITYTINGEDFSAVCKTTSADRNCVINQPRLPSNLPGAQIQEQIGSITEGYLAINEGEPFPVASGQVNSRIAAIHGSLNGASLDIDNAWVYATDIYESNGNQEIKGWNVYVIEGSLTRSGGDPVDLSNEWLLFSMVFSSDVSIGTSTSVTQNEVNARPVVEITRLASNYVQGRVIDDGPGPIEAQISYSGRSADVRFSVDSNGEFILPFSVTAFTQIGATAGQVFVLDVFDQRPDGTYNYDNFESATWRVPGLTTFDTVEWDILRGENLLEFTLDPPVDSFGVILYNADTGSEWDRLILGDVYFDLPQNIPSSISAKLAGLDAFGNIDFSDPIRDFESTDGQTVFRDVVGEPGTFREASSHLDFTLSISSTSPGIRAFFVTTSGLEVATTSRANDQIKFSQNRAQLFYHDERFYYCSALPNNLAGYSPQQPIQPQTREGLACTSPPTLINPVCVGNSFQYTSSNVGTVFKKVPAAVEGDVTWPSFCCPVDTCWGGLTCIAADAGAASVTQFGNVAYVCMKVDGSGEWQEAAQKFSPLGDQSGFCPQDTMCYTGEGCIESGESYNVGDTDYFCEEGEWKSLAVRLANGMMSYAQNYINEDTAYTLNCGPYDEVLNNVRNNPPDTGDWDGEFIEEFQARLQGIYYNVYLERGDAMPFDSITYEPTDEQLCGEEGNPCFFDFCVLNIPSEQRVIIGTTMNVEVSPYSTLGDVFGINNCDAASGDTFAECAMRENYDGDWVFNNQRNILLFDRTHQPSSDSGFFQAVTNSISGFFTWLGSLFSDDEAYEPLADLVGVYSSLYLKNGTYTAAIRPQADSNQLLFTANFNQAAVPQYSVCNLVDDMVAQGSGFTNVECCDGSTEEECSQYYVAFQHADRTNALWQMLTAQLR